MAFFCAALLLVVASGAKDLSSSVFFGQAHDEMTLDGFLGRKYGGAKPAPQAIQIGKATSELEVYIKFALMKPMCDLCTMEKQLLYVIPTGRSGSESIVQMLDLIPGFHITSGRHDSSMKTLMQIYHKAAAKVSKADLPKVLCGMQEFVKKFTAGYADPAVKVVGRKETEPHDATSLAFIKELFPCARFVVNTFAVPEISPQQLEAQGRPMMFDYAEFLVKFHSQDGGRVAFHLQKEDLEAARFNKLLAWLGVTGCQYSHVALARPDPSNLLNGVVNDRLGRLDGACSLDGMRLRFSRSPPPSAE